jgi:glycosyltransferase involved in cell wall biosynthesis
MAEQLGSESLVGFFGRARRKLAAEWLRVQSLLYVLNAGSRTRNALLMLRSGKFKKFLGKLCGRRPLTPMAGTVLGPVRLACPKPALHLAGSIHGPGGYDHLVLKALVGLTDAGIRVCRDGRAFLKPGCVPADYAPAERRYDWSTPRLAITPPHLLYWYKPTKTTAAWTMWETDTIPFGSEKYLNRCGLLLIPSRWGVECFRDCGVTVPMEVVPLGYDPDVFTPRAGSGPEICTFGTAGALTEGGLRKNVQRVIDLFRAAFPERTDVRLKVKISPRSPMVSTYGDSRIDVTNTPLSPSELAEWYRSLTCYVNASYGEGFGLHLLEAMGCGVPLISTTFSAVGEVFDSDVGYEVAYKLIEAKNAVYSGRWADPDNDELVARMHEVYADRDTAERLGRAAARRAPAFSWAESIRKLTAALAKHGYLPPEFAQSARSFAPTAFPTPDRQPSTRERTALRPGNE